MSRFYSTVPLRFRRAMALVALGAAIVALFAADIAILLSPEQLRRRLVAYASRFVRGEVDLEGVRFRLLGTGRVERATIRPRGEADMLLRIDGLTLRHAPLDLFFGDYRVTGIEVDAMEVRASDPARFLETFRQLFEIETVETARPPASIAIGRLVFDLGAVVPLTPARGTTRVELRRVRIDPHPGAPGRLWRLLALYTTGPFEDCTISGRIDLGEAVFELDIAASNVDVRERSLVGLPAGTRRAIEALAPRGPIDLTLTARVPWRRLADARVAGRVDCYALSVAPPAFGRPFTNISGRVRFDGPRLSIENVRGLYGTNEVRASGRIEDAGRWARVELGFFAPGFDLSDASALPLPEPLGTIVRAVDPRGKADIRVSFATSHDEPLERAGFRAQAETREAELWEGRVARLAGELSLEGILGTDGATGRIRLERAEIAGVPLEGVAARAALSAGRLALDRAEGRAAGGAFWASLEADRATIAGERGALRIDAAARDVRLAPLLSSLYGRPIDLDGRASGTLSIAREPAAPHSALRLDLELGPADLGPLPPLAPLFPALGAAGAGGARCRSGKFLLQRAAGEGEGHVMLMLRFLAASLAAEARIAPDWTIEGEARVTPEAGKAATYSLKGPIEMPEVRPAVPAAVTRTAD
jgi:hypothetical protein